MATNKNDNISFLDIILDIIEKKKKKKKIYIYIHVPSNYIYDTNYSSYVKKIINRKESYTERKKKRRVNFIPKFHSSLKKFVKYFTMITKRYMYGTKVPNFIGL